MDTPAIGPNGLSLNPKGDRDPHQGDSGRRQPSPRPIVSDEVTQGESTGEHGLSGIAERLGATLERSQDGSTFNRIVA